MKTVILAGGFGTRLSEETTVRPKPMVEIGGKPILWHIMKIYGYYGYNEFAIALGYKGEFIKTYFLHYTALNRNLTVNVETGAITQHGGKVPDWTVHLWDTGMNSMTGGRVGRLRELIGNETFMLTYGDGVSNIDIAKLVEFHRDHGKLGTLTAVRPPARYGSLEFTGNRIDRFAEKMKTGEAFVNGGYMILEPEVFDYIKKGDATDFENDVLPAIAADGELMAFRHDDFWQSMDTLRDVKHLQSLWDSGNPPWKIWK